MEIENYIDHATLQDAVKSVHTSIYEKGSTGGQFDHALFFERLKPSKPREKIYKLANKVKVADKVCEDVADLSVLDLKKQITRLVDFIQRSN